jgi:hypothetical protein
MQIDAFSEKTKLLCHSAVIHLAIEQPERPIATSMKAKKKVLCITTV